VSYAADRLASRLIAQAQAAVGARMRALTPAELKRWHEMFTQLYAEREDHEPENEEQRTQTRVERLRGIYPDVFEAIGSTAEEPGYAEQARKEQQR
jgi:hypothetical protein